MNRKSIIFVATIILALLTLISACGKETTEKHIYDSAQVKDVLNGSRTEKIGEYSIVKINSNDATLEALTDWYYNYVAKNDFNWNMIIYTDKEKPTGVYAINGFIEKDISFDVDKYGDYSVSESSNTTVYIPLKDGTLKEQAKQN